MGVTCCTEIPVEINKPTLSNVNAKRVDKYSKVVDYRKKLEYVSSLGAGSFGKVKLFRDKQFQNIKYAIKTLKKEGISKNMYDCLITEINILRSLDHPNIIKYYGSYEDDFYINIVMEYLAGENLMKYISLKKHYGFGEKEMTIILRQLLKALSFCHKKNIVHRDIKPENILFGKSNDYTTMKLIDFGLATTIIKKDKKCVGSPYYMSPEIINGRFSAKSDLWSVGVMLHYMVVGKFPFEAEHHSELFDAIQNKKFDDTNLNKAKCSSEVKELIKKLLTKDENKRYGIEETLAHPWFKKFEDEEIDETFTTNINFEESIISFSKKTPFQKEVIFFIAKIVDNKDVLHYRQFFNKLDYTNSGTITLPELKKAFTKFKSQLTEKDIDELWKNINFHTKEYADELTYSEFLAGLIGDKEIYKEENLSTAFEYFCDTANTGNITFDSLIKASQAFGVAVNEEPIKETFESLGTKDNLMNYDCFKDLMKK